MTLYNLLANIGLYWLVASLMFSSSEALGGRFDLVPSQDRFVGSLSPIQRHRMTTTDRNQQSSSASSSLSSSPSDCLPISYDWRPCNGSNNVVNFLNFSTYVQYPALEVIGYFTVAKPIHSGTVNVKVYSQGGEQICSETNEWGSFVRFPLLPNNGQVYTWAAYDVVEATDSIKLNLTGIWNYYDQDMNIVACIHQNYWV